MRSATAFAPATVANVAVGFDVLGFAVEGIGDTVTVSEGPSGLSVRASGVEVPTDPARNSASVALAALLRSQGIEPSHRITIEKGIPLSSGLGGSAASAVGAVVAVNALLESPLPRERLIPFAVEGEEAASGSAHADNVMPCLFGGMTAVLPVDPPEAIPIPVPGGLRCVLVRPHVEVETRAARAILGPTVELAAHAKQSALLTAFVTACFREDLDLVSRSLRDVLVEPQRASSISGFVEAQEAALSAGALGCSLSGSGPTVFALTTLETEDAVASALVAAFDDAGVETDRWISPVGALGARTVG